MSICVPDGTDWGCALSDEEILGLDPALKERSEALAWSTLSALLGYRLSLCPVSIRPCAAGCSTQTWDQAMVYGNDWNGVPSGGVFAPYVSNGSWFNGCGCKSADSCGCTAINQIILPTPAGDIVSVSLEGSTLDPSAYRVDNGNKLVRQDGGTWPVCQDMNLPASDPAAFVITYYPHLGPNELLRYAAGILAAEYYKSCSGGKCRLPNGVTSITRTGVTMEIPSGLFPNGATGLREVDPIIRIYNPNGVKAPARVLSPDSARARVTTWSA